jgi:hypothetical protein
MKFTSVPEHVCNVEMPVGDLRGYPQLLRCSPDYSHGHEGLEHIIKAVKQALRSQWTHISIDTRLSMLMPGMYPCIPGWHCDDFYRPNGGQPDLRNAPPAEHICVVLGNCSLTRFVNEPLNLPLPEPGDYELRSQTLYEIAHRRIEILEPQTVQVKANEIWRFDQLTWHRGEPATEIGWRYFLRLTGSNHWTTLNQIRTQTQVYLTKPFAGW